MGRDGGRRSCQASVGSVGPGKGSTMSKENRKGVRDPSQQSVIYDGGCYCGYVGTRLGELEQGDIGKLSLPSFKDGEHNSVGGGRQTA